MFKEKKRKRKKKKLILSNKLFLLFSILHKKQKQKILSPPFHFFSFNWYLFDLKKKTFFCLQSLDGIDPLGEVVVLLLLLQGAEVLLSVREAAADCSGLLEAKVNRKLLVLCQEITSQLALGLLVVDG